MSEKHADPPKQKRILPPTYLLISIFAMVVLHYLWPIKVIVTFPWTFLSLIPLSLGILLNAMADRAFKNRHTTVTPFEKSTSLVTKSAFAISRNPMYLGFTLILLGIAVFLGAVTPFLIVPVFALLMDCIFIRVEESMMKETFGKAWEDYATKVRRWI